MSTNANRVLEDALRLPEDERATVATSLLESLSSPNAIDNLSDEEWLAEIARRADATVAGQSGVPWEQVQENVRRRLHSK